MREHRERLALEFEPGDHLARGEAELQDLERDAATHRRLLLREEHLAHRTLADTLENPIGPIWCGAARRGNSGIS